MNTCAVRRVTIPFPGMRPVEAQRTVLLVCGDGDLRAALGRALGAAGYRVITAAHSGHALLAGITGEPIELIVTELAMEDMSGPALTERIRRHHPGLQAVYLAQPGTRECEGVLVRPFTRDDLLAQVAAAAVGQVSSQ